jgi:hypothetical protein
MTEPTDVDILLAAWASGIRLPAEDADSIRRRILAEPPSDPNATPGPKRRPSRSLPRQNLGPGGLPPGWWQTFALQVADVVVNAHRPPAALTPARG